MSDGKRFFHQPDHTYQFNQLTNSYIIREVTNKNKHNLISRIIIGDIIAGGIGIFADIMSSEKEYAICKRLTTFLQLTNVYPNKHEINLITMPVKTIAISYKTIEKSATIMVNELSAVVESNH
ncbi:hypothetical protein ACFQH1_03970 [Lactiplantibacillus daoliensis]|uniref:Uncharacterized protein n=1 Tax=Lactiplantibacillus daoliensis TaxID=2559916 RepID=A0ABW1UF72_9LACO|nr:hypothetical protein [Lactiplantibacillus daoliensis]